ncbi:MAG TPA: helix-turn-helix domain-containing protein [Flavisolibacter sp.]|nr:helix-turn-helix domain-containing protein [Flavisolibacter sp.]
MLSAEWAPAPLLQNYIHRYWVVQTGADFSSCTRQLYADGCINLIYNCGQSIVKTFPCNGLLKPGRLYIAGTATTPGTLERQPASCFIGIRFLPGGFHSLYGHPADGIVNVIGDFHEPELQMLLEPDDGLKERLDDFFLSKLPSSQPLLVQLVQEMRKARGQLAISRLAGLYNISTRTLERHFKLGTGAPPKEIANILRFQTAIKKLKSNGLNESLLRLSVELGYADHAHLSRECKRYAGLSPEGLRKAGLS